MTSRSIGTRQLAAAAILVTLALTACTTNLKKATDAYHNGDWDTAVTHAHDVAPHEDDGAKVTALKVPYDRDRMWVGLEKAKILTDSGAVPDGLLLYEHVDSEATHLRAIESFYQDNPLDTSNWDLSQFGEDASQAVVGADQTTYLLQPYEMILVKAYSSLACLVSDSAGAAAPARGCVRLQTYEAEDLQSGGYEVVQTAPAGKIDALVNSEIPQGGTSDFSFAKVFTLGDFDGAKARMKQVIEQARAQRAADPRVAFASAVQWAAFVAEPGGQGMDEANAAARAISEMSGASTLSSMMQWVMQPDRRTDFVLVLVDAGRGPVRQSFDVRFPIVIPNVGNGWFRAVYPELSFRTEDRPSSIRVKGPDGKERSAELLDSIDAIVARNFQRREPELWWTPTIRAAIRVIATIAVSAADKDAAKWALLANVLVAEAEQPDLRMWSTLPGAQYGLLIPRPPGGVVDLELSSDKSSGALRVEVPEGSSVVYVRALSPGLSRAFVGQLLPSRVPPSTAESMPEVKTSTTG